MVDFFQKIENVMFGKRMLTRGNIRKYFTQKEIVSEERKFKNKGIFETLQEFGGLLCYNTPYGTKETNKTLYVWNARAYIGNENIVVRAKFVGACPANGLYYLENKNGELFEGRLVRHDIEDVQPKVAEFFEGVVRHFQTCEEPTKFGFSKPHLSSKYLDRYLLVVKIGKERIQYRFALLANKIFDENAKVWQNEKLTCILAEKPKSAAVVSLDNGNEGCYNYTIKFDAAIIANVKVG